MSTMARRLSAAILSFTCGTVVAGEIRVACYSDGNECEVTQESRQALRGAESGRQGRHRQGPVQGDSRAAPGAARRGRGARYRARDRSGRTVEVLPRYHALREGPEVLGSELRPDACLDAPEPADKGIYGMMTQLTVTGPVREQDAVRAGRDVRCRVRRRRGTIGPTRRGKVAKATQVPFAMAFDRSGHRFAGPAISMGAKYFDAQGQPDVDDGYKAMAKKFYDWNRDGTMPKEVWGGVGGATYRDAFEEFANGRVVSICPEAGRSGGWILRSARTSTGSRCRIHADPPRARACPGGAAFVALKRTKNPKDVGRFLDFLASEPVYAEYMAQTDNIPAHAGVAKKGVDYKCHAAGQSGDQRVRRRGCRSCRRSPTRSRATGSTARSSIPPPRGSARRSLARCRSMTL